MQQHRRDWKDWIKHNAPAVVPPARVVLRRLRWVRGRATRTVRRMIYRGLPTDTVERRFARIYKMNAWRGPESACGPGSSLAETAAIRARLPGLLRDLNAKHMLDIPCGDHFWMNEVALDIAYTGADVVSEIVDRNNEVYGSAQRRFVHLDLLKDPLPCADLVLCRDCLDHLTIGQIEDAISNVIRSGSTYLLATTYPGRDANPDIRTGDWRPVNLERAPFWFPEPIRLIDEASEKPGYPDKSLGLWRVADLRDRPARHEADGRPEAT